MPFCVCISNSLWYFCSITAAVSCKNIHWLLWKPEVSPISRHKVSFNTTDAQSRVRPKKEAPDLDFLQESLTLSSRDTPTLEVDFLTYPPKQKLLHIYPVCHMPPQTKSGNTLVVLLRSVATFTAHTARGYIQWNIYILLGGIYAIHSFTKTSQNSCSSLLVRGWRRNTCVSPHDLIGVFMLSLLKRGLKLIVNKTRFLSQASGVDSYMWSFSLRVSAILNLLCTLNPTSHPHHHFSSSDLFKQELI